MTINYLKIVERSRIGMLYIPNVPQTTRTLQYGIDVMYALLSQTFRESLRVLKRILCEVN